MLSSPLRSVWKRSENKMVWIFVTSKEVFNFQSLRGTFILATCCAFGIKKLSGHMEKRSETVWKKVINIPKVFRPKTVWILSCSLTGRFQTERKSTINIYLSIFKEQQFSGKKCFVSLIIPCRYFFKTNNHKAKYTLMVFVKPEENWRRDKWPRPKDSACLWAKMRKQ